MFSLLLPVHSKILLLYAVDSILLSTTSKGYMFFIPLQVPWLFQGKKTDLAKCIKGYQGPQIRCYITHTHIHTHTDNYRKQFHVIYSFLNLVLTSSFCTSGASDSENSLPPTFPTCARQWKSIKTYRQSYQYKQGGLSAQWQEMARSYI